MQDIKRATELFLCEKLRIAVPKTNFVPFSGGTEKDDQKALEPPFVVVSVTEAQKMFEQESTWTAKGVVQVVTHHGETKPGHHSSLTRGVYAALDGIPAGYTQDFSFHGISIVSQRSVIDDSLSARVDVIEFVAGVGG